MDFDRRSYREGEFAPQHSEREKVDCQKWQHVREAQSAYRPLVSHIWACYVNILRIYLWSDGVRLFCDQKSEKNDTFGNRLQQRCRRTTTLPSLDCARFRSRAARLRCTAAMAKRFGR